MKMNIRKIKKYWKKLKHWKHWKNLLFSAGLLVIFGGFLFGLMRWESAQKHMPPPTQPHQPQSSVSTEPAETQAPTTIPPEATLPKFEPRKINFLLVGRDFHAEGENGRSDSMILCSADTGSGTMTMISFLRDIYLKIPGHGSNRLNASYSWGGAELLKETLKENFDVDVDVTLEIDFEGFENTIDYLGGVDVELTDLEAEHLNNSYGWKLTQGTNHLDGAQALAYSRIRKLDSDFGRTERQRNVLVALMEQYRGASLQEMLHVTDEFLEQSISDHTDEELLSYALELYAMMNDFEIITHRVPADGTYTYETIRGMSVVDIDFEENTEILQDLLR